MDTPDDRPLNPNQRYAPYETAITYFSYNPNHSQQPWKAMMLHRSSCKLSSYATRSQLRRKPTVVDKRNVTFNPEVRGYGMKVAQQLTWQNGQVGHSATSTTQQRHDEQNSGGQAMEGKEVVFEVVTPLQEQGRGRARAVQGHNAVGRSVGVDIPIPLPQLPTAQLESTLTFPEATVNEQAVWQAGGQRVGKIARVPLLAAPNRGNYGKQPARNDIAGDIVQSAIIHGPRASRPTPITHPTHLAVEERTGDDQETSDIANFALFTRVIQVPAKKARDHPLVYAAQKEVDGLYKMGTLTWVLTLHFVLDVVIHSTLPPIGDWVAGWG
eukprot:g45003.t1